MRPVSKRISMELVLGAVLAASLAVILHQARRLMESQRREEADAQTVRLLQEAVRRKDMQLASAPPPEEAIATGDHAGMARKEAVIERLDRELAQDRASITALQSQLSAANDQNAKALASEEGRWQKQQADAQAQLQDLQKKLDGASADSDIARQRITVLETDIARLKSDDSSLSIRAADLSHAIASLQDIDRRRDIYLTSILRRYRDITGEFRAMSNMLDSSHDPNSSACSGVALSRIQNAVNSAEDDMRQLSELNARAQKVEKEIAGK